MPFEIETHKKADVLQTRLLVLKEAKKDYENAYGMLIEALEDVETYLEAITVDSEFKVIID